MRRGAIREGWNSRFESAWANRNQFIEEGGGEGEKPIKQGRTRRWRAALGFGGATASGQAGGGLRPLRVRWAVGSGSGGDLRPLMGAVDEWIYCVGESWYLPLGEILCSEISSESALDSILLLK